jgi:hypothetical protein
MNAFSDIPGEAQPATKPGPVLVMPTPEEPPRSHVWISRIWLVVFVLVCLELGIILMVGPWTRAWTENSLSSSYPAFHEFLMNGFVRGAVTGLGLVDFWIGIARAVSYREKVS